MSPWRRHCILGALLLLAAPAGAGEVCRPGPTDGRVSLLILDSPARVYELARSVARKVPVLAQGSATVVFEDGRVVTSDVDAATQQINELGWGEHRLNVVGSFGARRMRPPRVGGG